LGCRAGGRDRRGRRVLVLAGSRSGKQRRADGIRRAAGPGRTPRSFGAALAPVQAATATSEAVPRYLTGLGTVTAANTVTVRSRVDGQLLAIHFQKASRSKRAICWRKSTQPV
jgi:multidrug efflux pump subunit AcrA (membrane-fusion protein)